MLKNYLITTLRSLKRNQLNTFINLIGLTLGIACAILLSHLALYFLGYNKFESNYHRIARIVNHSPGQGGEEDYTPGVPLPFVAALIEDFPDFDEVVLVRDYYGETLFTIEPDAEAPVYFELQDQRLAYVPNEYFSVFDRAFLEGDKNTALVNPNTVVISSGVANNMFPEGNALGKTIAFNKDEEYVITGIMADHDVVSDMPFDILFSQSTRSEEIKNGHWGSVSSSDQCYVLLPEGKRVEDYQERLNAFTAKHFDAEDKEVYELQPMTDLHFNSKYATLSYSSIDPIEITVMMIIAIFLVLTACVNFINLSTAIAVERAREIGVRKVLGGTKQQLIFQFLSESFVLILVSALMALGVAELMLLKMNPFLETSVNLDLLDPQFMVHLI